jgi:hypothetical protein
MGLDPLLVRAARRPARVVEVEAGDGGGRAEKSGGGAGELQAQSPTTRRSPSIDGSPARWIFRLADSTSYATRSK